MQSTRRPWLADCRVEIVGGQANRLADIGGDHAARCAALLGRLLLAALFVPSGFDTLSDIAGTSGYFAGLGLPLPTLAAWATGLFELIAGLLILVGLKTPIAACCLPLSASRQASSAIIGQGGDDPTLALMHAQALMKDIADRRRLSGAGHGRRWRLLGRRGLAR